MYERSTLSNGLRVITSTMPHTRSVCLSLFIGTGSRYEAAGHAGISHFIEHMLFKGSEKYPTARDISVAVEGVGGIINGGTDKELTVYWAKVPQNHFLLALDVLTDMVLHPRLDPLEMEKERQVIIEEISMTKDSPSQLVNLLVDELIWPNHPMGQDIAGTRETVACISRENMAEYLHHQYQPANIVVSIAGDFPHHYFVDTVGEKLGSWTAKDVPLGYTAYKPSPAARLKIEKKDTEQVHLCLAVPGLPLLHPYRFALDLFDVILGEGMSSRLFTEIRERLGLAYSIHSYTDHFLDTGSVNVYAGVDPRNLDKALTAILREMKNLKDIVPAADITRAKELSKGRLMLRLEDSRNVSGWLGGQEVLTGRVLVPDELIAIVDRITADDLMQVASELLTSDELRLALVGPIARDKPLEELLAL